MTILLREAVGDRLRHARTTQQRTLREISREARVSLGYLSEVERGQKEASSELLASICGALELPLAELLHHVAADIGAAAQVSAMDEVTDPKARPAGEDASGDGEARETAIQAGTIVPPMVGGDRSDVRMPPGMARRFRTRLDASDVVVAA
jgi:transcriptional regulator with XRE-family HTH domain